MVKIALDTENYDKFIGTVQNLDIVIEKFKDQLNPLPKDIGCLLFALGTKKEISTKMLSRNDIHRLKKLSFLFKFKLDTKKACNSGRPNNLIKKDLYYEENLDLFTKIGLFYRLLKCNSLSEVIYAKIENLDYDFNNPIISYLDNNYIILQRNENKLLLFRFIDTMLNNALIVRINKIVKIYNSLSSEHWYYLDSKFRNSF